MHFLDLPTHRLHYRVDGREGAPWLTFCNSLGTDLYMWDPQVDALAAEFRILRYDRRGHGESGTPPGRYAIADLGGDVLALWDALGVQRSHYCGLSIGGLTAQWLALHAPERVQRVAVAATAAKIGSAESWQARIAQVAQGGLLPLVEGTLERWFTPGYAAAHPLEMDEIVTSFMTTSREGYIGCCEAVGSADFRAALAQLQVPLLAIAGDEDPVCPPGDLLQISTAVPDGHFVKVHGRHICNLESATAFTTALREFLLR